jgi:hypothetical protein
VIGGVDGPVGHPGGGDGAEAETRVDIDIVVFLRVAV